MLIGKDYKEQFSHFENKKGVCDRCGNDFNGGRFLIHLPYKKIYIEICGICQNGLMYGYYIDAVNAIKREKL